MPDLLLSLPRRFFGTTSVACVTALALAVVVISPASATSNPADSAGVGKVVDFIEELTGANKLVPVAPGGASEDVFVPTSGGDPATLDSIKVKNGVKIGETKVDELIDLNLNSRVPGKALRVIPVAVFL